MLYIAARILIYHIYPSLSCLDAPRVHFPPYVQQLLGLGAADRAHSPKLAV
jgi:hypothetical protein